MSSAPKNNQPVTTEDALGILGAKMESLSHELIDGLINQAQYEAIFTHYVNKRAVLLRLIERNATQTAILRAIGEGATALLRQQYKASVVGFAIFSHIDGSLIRMLGDFNLPAEMINSLSATVRINLRHSYDADQKVRVHCTQVEAGRWSSYAEGQTSSSIAVFSAEPSSMQLVDQQYIHLEFEIVNQHLLGHEIIDPTHLIYPQETLLI